MTHVAAVACWIVLSCFLSTRSRMMILRSLTSNRLEICGPLAADPAMFTAGAMPCEPDDPPLEPAATPAPLCAAARCTIDTSPSATR